MNQEMNRIDGNNALANLNNGTLANYLQQAKTKSEDYNIIDLIAAREEAKNNEYVLKRVVPGLPDYKKHQIRLEKGERFAVRLQEIFDERGIETAWNPNESNKLNVIGNIQFCWKILKPTVPAPIAKDWGVPENITTNEGREEYFRTKHPKVYEKKAKDLEYMLNWIFDVIKMLGLHNTRNGYSYTNIKAIKEAFESHYSKVSTPRGMYPHLAHNPAYLKVCPFDNGIGNYKGYENCHTVSKMEEYKINYVATVQYLAETVK